MALVSVFASWLAAGLVWSLAISSSRDINQGFFRSTLLVILGMIVTAYVTSEPMAGGWAPMLLIASGVVSYVGFVAWSIGQDSLGVWSLRALSALLAGVLVSQSMAEHHGVLSGLGLLDAGTGAFLLGVSMSAMLLGHYYLTAPWMSLAPLQRLIVAIFLACAVRALACGLADFGAWKAPGPSGTNAEGDSILFLTLRYCVGMGAPAVLAAMALNALRWKNTQAATGILYVVVICTFFGEAMAIALAHWNTGAPPL